jgi:internalin A
MAPGDRNAWTGPRSDFEAAGLTSLPPDLFQNTRLRTLILDRNQLTALPPEIGQLTNLQALSLTLNRLTTLPPEIGLLTNLRILKVNGNLLTALPPEIGQLTNLQTLELSLNRLAALPPEIGQLTNLHTLKVSRNRLTALPPEIGQLTNLQGLALDRNQLTALPPEIGQLTKLQTLALDRNQLTGLPMQLAELVSQMILRLEDNPLHEPLPTLLGRDAEALASYLRSLEGAVPQYEAKVVLVGEGNVGKTSLVAALCGGPFVENRPTTHGIEVQPLQLKHPELGLDMTVRAWDFGVQEVYRITHQFFFSRRALYLIVWSAREGQEQNEVEGWLRRIRLRVKQDARALVVATYCDERQPELDYRQLEQAFRQLLVGRYSVDNRSTSGISDLRQGIAEQVARLPQMGQLISPRWSAARDEIIAVAETEPQIPFEQFANICRHHQVDGDEIVTLVKLMHDLGHIVYYGEDEGLRDFVVLDPEWLTKAISYVLEDKEIRQSDGVLEHRRLTEIWQDRDDGPAYPVRYHPYFLRLMEKFDVSYRLEDDEYCSLVAQLVPHDRPGLPWDTSTALPRGIRSLALVCELSEPVPGLVAWLTVRHHRASIGSHWRNGVFLRYPITAYASEALIELRSPRQLAIDVRAPSPDLLFNVLRDSVEDLITRRWPGLDYRLLVPCRTHADDGHRCLGQFPLDGLLRYRERGGTHYVCLECGHDHDVSELLTGFGQPDRLVHVELERLRDQVADVGRDIISVAGGLNRLEGYAAETADSVRRVLRVVGSEITDCPRLFTLSEVKPTGTRRLKKYQRHYRLMLWCEHIGHWHPWPAASYSLDEPREWLNRIGPYATLVFKALQLVVPIAASIADMVMTDEQLKRAQIEIQMMKTLVAELPNEDPKDQRVFMDRESASQLTSLKTRPPEPYAL